MKSMLLASIALLFSGLLHAQNELDYKSLEGKVKTLTETVSYKILSSDEWDSNVTKFSFTIGGDLLVYENYYKDNLSKSIHYEYDSKGMILKEMVFNKSDRLETITEMNQLGKPWRIWKASNNEKPKLFIENIYDKRGNISHYKIMNDQGNEIIPNDSKFDDQNRVIEKVYRNSLGDPLEHTYTSTYDQAGRLSEFNFYINKKLDSKTTYQYDQAGRVLKENTWNETYKDNKSVIKIYNNLGHLTEMRSRDYGGREIIKKYISDKYGNIIREESSGGYGGDAVLENVYTYDKTGNWIKKEEFRSGGRRNLDKELYTIHTRAITYY